MILSCLLLPGTVAFAQLYVRSESYTIRDGLSDNRISSIHKDKVGFLWIGTQNGLNRYDGHDFRVYRPSRSNSISNEIVNDIACDDSGYLWVATMDGLNRYDARSDHWKNIYPTPDSSRPGLPNWLVWSLYADEQQQLWIATDVRELAKMDLKTGAIQLFNWPDFARKHPVLGAISYRSIQKIVPGRPGKLWLGTNRGLVEFDKATGRFEYRGGGYNANLRDMQYDPEGEQVWLVTEDAVVLNYSEKTGGLRTVSVRRLPYPSTSWLVPADSDRWMASPEGLLQWRSADQTVWLHPHIDKMDGYLPPGGTSMVFQEAPGVIWVGTPNGLSRMNWGRGMARYLPLVPTSFSEGMNRLASVYRDPETGQYFVAGGMENRVYVVSTNKPVVEYDTDLTGRRLSTCNAIVADAQGRKWLLTEDRLYRWDNNRKGFQPMSVPPRALAHNFRDLVSLPDSSLLLAAFSSGLWRFDPDTQSWRSFPDHSAAMAEKPTSLANDPLRRRIWIGTFNDGLFYYDLPSGKIIHQPKPDEHREAGAPMGLIHDVSCDNRGRLLVATVAAGLYSFERKADGRDQWSHFSMREGLLSNMFLSVVSGKNGDIWALSGHRVHHLDSNGQNRQPLVLNRVMPISTHSSDYRMPHSIFYDESNDQLLYASGGGLNLVPGSAGTLPQAFPLVLTDIQIGGSWKRLFDPHTSGPLEVPYTHNEIQFHFAGLYFESNSGIRFQYKLEGHDRQWMEGKLSAGYNNLNPGNYRFRVRVLQPNQEKVIAETSFSFYIVPPFWRTWWFVSSLIILVGLGLYTWIQNLRQNVRNQKILTYFATSLYGQNSVEDIFWDVARNCIGQLRFEDCVIYQFDEDRQVLVQRAAYGPKSPDMKELVNPLEIAIGVGIVGDVALHQRAEIINDTSRDPRYIVDDEHRMSEMAVPILADNKLIGVIDSENRRKNFYTRGHLRLLTRIAEICAAKVSKYQIEERLRLKIARDLHDEMGSTLTSINIISKVAMENVSADATLKEQLQKIKDYSLRMMDSMSDIVWAINPSNDSLEKTLVRMREFAAEILEPAGISYYFSEENCLHQLQLNIEKRKELYMLFKEAITNAAKYSQATEVNILLKVIGDMLQLRVVDNGKGFDVNATSSGNGLRNMRIRARQLNAVFMLESIPGAGTAIELTIPITS